MSGLGTIMIILLLINLINHGIIIMIYYSSNKWWLGTIVRTPTWDNRTNWGRTGNDGFMA